MDTNCFGCTGRTPLGLLYYGRDGGDSLNLRQDSIPQMRGTKVHGLTVDRAGRIWVGYTGEGIQYFDWPIAPNTSFAFNNVENTGNFDVRALESRGDTVWAMTTRDVRIYYRPIAAFVDSFLLPSVPADLALRPLAIGPDGTVYVGTTVGMRVRKLNGSIEDFNVSNSPIAGNAVQAIRVDPATGVVWIGTGSGLSRYDPGYRPPPPPPAPKLSFTLYPNPSKMNALGISLTIAGIPGLWRGAIYDLNGRILHAFAGSGGGVAIWDGRDRDGNLVRPGIYFVHVESRGSSDTKRIAILR
jgi:ligand-binding sensor domain-containing protein